MNLSTSTTSTDSLKAALLATAAIAEAIRTAGEIPSGTLYAMVIGKMDLAAYTGIIRTLKNTGLVTESGNLLRWAGPFKGEVTP